MKTTVWIFGNQLPLRSRLLEGIPRETPILMIEAKARGRIFRYPKKKLVLIYSAMRHTAEELRRKGYRVDYHTLTETESFEEGFERHRRRHRPQRILTLHPADYPQLEWIRRWEERNGVAVELAPNDLFLTDIAEFRSWASGRRRLLMEARYRLMRTRLGILVDARGKPVGGKWNFDQENRAGYTEGVEPGAVRMFPPDDLTREVMRDVESVFPDHPGSAEGFRYPVTQRQARLHLRRFVEERLDRFGTYQDMMAEGEPHLYHALLSPALNIGLLHPMDVVQAVVQAYHDGKARLPSVEGMIRQVIGWREFVYGVYWTFMPGYRDEDFFRSNRPVPAFFRTGSTPMNCLKNVIRQTLDEAYAHHIQRLMVISNFSLLAGLDPRDVLRWFMEMYVDAYDWVMVPNVIGMGMFADGGRMATKPYVSSGAYINRMSNYCRSCAFDVGSKTGEQACPFNYLFWNFLAAHASRLKSNQRLAMLYRTLERKSDEERREIRSRSRAFLAELENL